MRLALILWSLAASPVLGCDDPVCLVARDDLHLARMITFDDQPSSPGPGRRLDDILVIEGARFGERLAGQINLPTDQFDHIEGQPDAPLMPLAGPPAQSLSIARVYGTNVLSGDGPIGHPSDDATGEGAIAVVFDRDQAEFAFDLRGGEAGTARIALFRRDGSQISEVDLTNLAEDHIALQRQGRIPDIAGFVLTNVDPAGIGIDNLAFDGQDRTS